MNLIYLHGYSLLKVTSIYFQEKTIREHKVGFRTRQENAGKDLVRKDLVRTNLVRKDFVRKNLVRKDLLRKDLVKKDLV